MVRLAALYILSFIALTLSTFGNTKNIKLDFFRFNENHKHLAKKNDLSVYERLKYIPFLDKGYASFGGQYRAQNSYLSNAGFGLINKKSNNKLLNRFLLHGDFHFSKNIRTFIEVGSYQADVTTLNPGPFDEDSINLQQAFLDIKHDNFMFRIGRQEAAFGSARLIGVRDGPNIRRSFDGIKFVGNFSSVKIQSFVYQEAKIKEKSFLSGSNNNEKMSGIYTTWHNIGDSSINTDVYYIRTNRGIAQYIQTNGRDKRQTLGTRVFGQYQSWDWDYELIYQFGDFQNTDISAWSIATLTEFTFKNKPWSPKLSLSINIASGDDDPNDSTLNTFNPIYPNLYYFEKATLLAPQNFFNIKPAITMRPQEFLTFTLSWDFFWKHKKNDGIYTAGLLSLPNTYNTQNRFVTHVPSLEVGWNMNKNALINLSYSHFFTNNLIKDAGGTDVDFIQAEFTFTF